MAMRRKGFRLDMPETRSVVPYQDAATPAEVKALMAAAGIRKARPDEPLLPARLATLGAGAGGRFGGRVPWETMAPAHLESSAAVRGLYPWIPGAALPARGPMLGRDAWSGGAWCYDPWELRRLGLVGDSGIFISGVIGSGKSALAKCFAMRHTAFGRPFVVPADIRGEWVPVAEAVGGKVMRLGPGMPNRLNALAMPPRPDGIDEAAWWLTVRTHWETLLEALIETLFRGTRVLTPVETTAIEVALMHATNHHAVSGDVARLAPIHLALIVDLLLDPTAQMAQVLHMSKDELRHTIRDIGLALRKLTAGSLQGLVDSTDPDNQIDPRSPATVVDISAVQTSDASLALVMACTQSVMELSFAHRVQQWILAYDELWRQARFPKLIARIDAAQRVSRKTGASTLAITHRLTDGEGADPAAQQAFRDLMANCATKVIYKQRADTIRAAGAMVDLSDMAQAEVLRLGRGRAVWVVEGKPYVVDHILGPPVRLRNGSVWSEHDVINTDQALMDSYRSLAGKTADQLWAA